MIIKKVPLFDVYQTARQMRRLICEYFADLGPWLDVPFVQFYKHVCLLPYVEDPETVETVSRPAFTLDPNYCPRDCDDKAVLIGAWFKSHGDPIRVVASSTRRNGSLHHTFIQLGNGLFIDGTYPEYCNLLGYYPYFPHITKLQALTNFF